MSVKVMSMVWEHGPAKASERLMLLAIADHADDSGAAFPGVERLARKCCVTLRPAQNTIRALERDGWMTVEVGGGRNNTNHYQINLDRLTTPPTPLSTAPPLGSTGNPAVHDGNPAVLMQETPLSTAPEPSVEPSVEPVLAFSAMTTAIDLFDTFWSEYPRDGRVESKKETRAAWEAALKKDSPTNIIAALRRQLPHMRQQVRGGANYNKHAKRWLSHEMWREPVPTVGTEPRSGVWQPKPNKWSI